MGSKSRMKLRSFKMSELDIRTLDVLAKHLGQTKSEALRTALRLAYMQLTPHPTLTPPPLDD